MYRDLQVLYILIVNMIDKPHLSKNKCTFANHFKAVKLLKQFLMRTFQLLFTRNSFAILLVLSVIFLFSACHNDKNPSQEGISIKASEGICLTHTFENNEWRFPVHEGIVDKTITFQGELPDPNANYKATIFVDFLPNIAIRDLHLTVTTTAPDGNTSWSKKVTIPFHVAEQSTTIHTDDGTSFQRFEKELYSDRTMSAQGAYSFEIYSSYAKLSLQGIKSISIKLEKDEREE